MLVELARIDNWEDLLQNASCLGITISSKQLAQLREFQELLAQHNQRSNLTRLSDLSDFLTFHLLDTLVLLAALKREQRSPIEHLDLGSGAGIPALILALFLEGRSSLCEAILKKVQFLNVAKRALNLESKLKVFRSRIEDLPKELNEDRTFGLVTARALSKPIQALNYTLPFVSPQGGIFAAQTSLDLYNDREYHKALFEKDARIVKQFDYKLADQKRYITLIIKKAAPML